MTYHDSPLEIATHSKVSKDVKGRKDCDERSSCTYLIRFFDLLLSQAKLDRLADLVAEQEQLHARCLRWLAGLLPQQRGETLLVGIDRVRKLGEVRSSVILREAAPRRERRFRRRYGTVDVLLRGDRHLGERLLVAGVDRTVSPGRGAELVVYHISKYLALELEHKLHAGLWHGRV